ncbi:MAG: glutamate synthase large subunit [Candidatus Marinimicrobia bacterium]|nr:glutamate synthase large subunit [Candidatus Neomarinimicrobiota bacterium]
MKQTKQASIKIRKGNKFSSGLTSDESFPLYNPDDHHDACGVGFIAEESGIASRRVLELSLKALNRLEHRGGKGFDQDTGDGAGLLVDIPWTYFKNRMNVHGMEQAGEQETLALAVTFSRNISNQQMEAMLSNGAGDLGLRFLGLMEVPIRPEQLGSIAQSNQPDILHAVFAIPAHGRYSAEQQTYLLRKKLEHTTLEAEQSLYFCSFSTRTIVYKGLLSSYQLAQFYPDLNDPDFVCRLAIFHERFSTNTNPSWEMAQPFHGIAHNGEINTIRGNRLWMHARERQLKSDFWKQDFKLIRPIITKGYSDSASFDEVFSVLVQSGKDPNHAMMMMVPDPYTGFPQMDRELIDFYMYHENFMEPWDGPAALIFTDGDTVGAKLDRNGLRPLRYTRTKSGLVIMASEAGVVDVEDDDLIVHHHMSSGEIYCVSLNRGVESNREIKHRIASQTDYGQLMEKNFLRLHRDEHATEFGDFAIPDGGFDKRIRLAHGWHEESVERFTKPLSAVPLEPLGAMGDDTPPVFLSTKSRSFYDYFVQAFAQVTNPPIDPIRERLMMSLYHYLGSEENLLAKEPAFHGAIRIASPVLSPKEVRSLMQMHEKFGHQVISILASTDQSFKSRLKEIQKECAQAVRSGKRILFLSDEHVNADRIPIPMALATSAVHHDLVKRKIRSNVSLICLAGDVYEDHHISVLTTLGASAVYPYMAYELIRETLEEEDWVTGMANYRFALEKGLLKSMAKMGISTFSSYQGSMLLHTVGLHEDFLKTWIRSLKPNIGGDKLERVQARVNRRHSSIYTETQTIMEDMGLYRVKRGGELHAYSPAIAKRIRKRATHQPEKIKEPRGNIYLRDLLEFKILASPENVKVEAGDHITKKFGVAAMSFGALSDEAHRVLTKGISLVGGRSNTGEGGETPDRYLLFKQNDHMNAHTKQVASGRFGVKADYLAAAQELQIKIAQGAKPGEGGQLPGQKVSVEIATARSSTPGIPLISPPPHHDIYSIEDLAQLIYDLKQSNPRARISVKLASQPGIGIVACGVVKAGADIVVISGGDGGTGASPLGSLKHTGMAWETGLAEAHQALIANNLRNKVTLRVDGGLQEAKDILVAAALGAQEYDFGSVALMAIGCVMVRRCHQNTCPVGIATQDPDLRKKFRGTPEELASFLKLLAEDIRSQLAEIGMANLDALMGRNDLLQLKTETEPGESLPDIDLSRILEPKLPLDWRNGEVTGEIVRRFPSFDEKILESIHKELLTHGQAVIRDQVSNRDRSIGTRLAGEIAFLFGESQFNGNLQYRLRGVAGQSFGAFLTHGIELRLKGLANDYVGKGMSGGLITIRMPREIRRPGTEHTMIGNVALYGATGGTLFVAGRANERFAVRNSGASAVVEGVGNHACEYMTRGTVIVLGEIGFNFGSGMTGGTAFLYDLSESDDQHLNTDFVTRESLSEADEYAIARLLERHRFHTGSLKTADILDNWTTEKQKFTKITPLVMQMLDSKALYDQQVSQRLGLVLNE